MPAIKLRFSMRILDSIDRQLEVHDDAS